MNIEKLRESIAAEKQRSAWDKGVTQYALELVDEWLDVQARALHQAANRVYRHLKMLEGEWAR